MAILTKQELRDKVNSFLTANRIPPLTPKVDVSEHNEIEQDLIDSIGTSGWQDPATVLATGTVRLDSDANIAANTNPGRAVTSGNLAAWWVNTKTIIQTFANTITFSRRGVFNGQSATNSPLAIPPSAVQMASNQAAGDFRNTNGLLSFFNVIWRNFLFSTGNPDLVGTGVRGLQTDASGNVSALAYQQLVTGRVVLVAGVATVTVARLTTAGNAMGSIRTSGGTGGDRYRFVCSANTLTITALDASGGTVTTDTSELYYLIEML